MRKSDFCRWCLLALMPAVCAIGNAEPGDQPSDQESGAFARMLREDRFVGPGILKVERLAERESQTVLPADFERCDRLALVADKLADQFPETFAALVKATPADVKLAGIVSDASGWDIVRRVLVEYKLPLDRISPARVPTDTIWIRDFGPIIVRSADGALVALDCEYRRRSGSRILARAR